MADPTLQSVPNTVRDRLRIGEAIPDLHPKTDSQEEWTQQVVEAALQGLETHALAWCGSRTARWVEATSDQRHTFQVSSLDASGYPTVEGVLFTYEHWNRYNDEIFWQFHSLAGDLPRVNLLAEPLYPTSGCYIDPTCEAAVQFAAGLQGLAAHDRHEAGPTFRFEATVGDLRSRLQRREASEEVLAAVVPCPTYMAAVAADLFFGPGSAFKLRPYLNAYFS